MKVLFIGGTGNISASVSRACVALGMDLWLLNRSGRTPIDGSRSLHADIHTPEAANILARHEWDAVVNWVAFEPADAERDIRLFSGKTGQYVFISSASCYKKPGPTPFITEQTPLENPHWAYSRNKIAAEQTLLRAHENAGFPITIVRPSHTYSSVIPITIGGWHEYTTVARMKKGLPIVVQGDGTALWTITHAHDFANGFVGLLGNRDAIGEAFHITSDEFLSWNEIYRLTGQAVGVTPNIVHVTSDRICQLDPEYTGTLLGDKAASALFDNSKIRRLVPSFKAVIPFEHGIRKTLAEFEANPARQTVNPKTNAFIEQLIADAQR